MRWSPLNQVSSASSVISNECMESRQGRGYYQVVRKEVTVRDFSFIAFIVAGLRIV